MTTTISRDDYLKAVGLYTLGREAQIKTKDYEDALYRHLGMENDGGHLSDALYGDRGFDEALRLQGFKVEA